MSNTNPSNLASPRPSPSPSPSPIPIPNPTPNPNPNPNQVLRDEDGLSEIVGDICVGTPERAQDSGAYPKYPGNPPLWGEMYTVSRS